MKKYKVFFKAIEPEELTVDAENQSEAEDLAKKAYEALLTGGGYIQIDEVVELEEEDLEADDSDPYPPATEEEERFGRSKKSLFDNED